MKYFVMFDYERDGFSVFREVSTIVSGFHCGPFASEGEAMSKARELNDRLISRQTRIERVKK